MSGWLVLSGVKARSTDGCFVAGARGWNINGQVPGGADCLLVRILFVGVLERGWFVVAGWPFGTLLGPEATGLPGRGVCPLSGGLFVSGFLAAPIAWFVPFFVGVVWGVWYGVVV